MTDGGVHELHHVAISVRDLDASLAFYIDVLGMRVGARGTLSGRGIARLLGLPDDIKARQAFVTGPRSVGQVELVEWPVPRGPAPREVTDLGLALISFRVSPAEFDVLLDRCRDRGVEIAGGPEILDVPDYDPTKLVLVRDPDGNLVEFMTRATEAEAADARAEAARA